MIEALKGIAALAALIASFFYIPIWIGFIVPWLERQPIFQRTNPDTFRNLWGSAMFGSMAAIVIWSKYYAPAWFTQTIARLLN